MKKLAAALTVVAAMLFGLSDAANADPGYPPSGFAVTVSPASGPPGFIVTVTADCQLGESVDVELEGESESAACAAAAPAVSGFRGAAALRSSAPEVGSATVEIATPQTPGSYTGSATGTASGLIGTFSVNVQAPVDTATGGALPSTGSDGTSTMVLIAASLLVVGLGIVGVASVRRRQHPVGV